jgi:hypothetical protein
MIRTRGCCIEKADQKKEHLVQTIWNQYDRSIRFEIDVDVECGVQRHDAVRLVVGVMIVDEMLVLSFWWAGVKLRGSRKRLKLEPVLF